MKRCKFFATALLLGAALGLAAPAGAYTIYNHVAYQACVIDAAYPTFCAITVEPNGTYKGGQGDPTQVWFNWNLKPGVCYLSQKIVDLPQDGSAKMYSDRVEVYDAKGNQVVVVGMRQQTCAERQSK